MFIDFVFVDFCWCLLMFISFYWFLLIFIEFYLFLLVLFLLIFLLIFYWIYWFFYFYWYTHFCCKFFLSQFTHFFRQFFEAKKQTPPSYPLLECMVLKCCSNKSGQTGFHRMTPTDGAHCRCVESEKSMIKPTLQMSLCHHAILNL